MDLGLHGKVALITAASRGIGLAASHAFAREGCQVVICGRDARALSIAVEELRASHHGEVLGLKCNLADAADIDSLVKAVIARFGTIHVLVNNGGGPRAGLFADLDDGDWQRAFDSTFMSAVRMTQAVVPCMQRQRWGRVINVSSYGVKQPIPDLLLSNSVRLGLIGWAKTLASQLAPDNVLVNTVGPGWTRTDRVTQMLESRAASGSGTPAEIEAEILARVPIGRMGRAEEIADVIAFLGSERASFVTGTFVAVDGGAVQSPL
jgi:3-oxoacyl-[acyl-carrier protein] reductase